MSLSGQTDIEHALELVGELLASDGHCFAVIVLGGAALNLLGIVERATTDVDILAVASPRTDGPPDQETTRQPPEPLPEPLLRAAATVARDLNLDAQWLNAGPALQWRVGFPPGLTHRVHWRQFSGLWVGVVARYDLIFFKLFAAADSTGPTSVHYQDLLALKPSRQELEEAGGWVRTQDASPEFATILEQVLHHVRADLALA